MTCDSLANWRRERGMSQTALAEAIGCSRRAIVNWETGITAIPRYIALALAAVEKKLKPVE